MDIIEFYGDRAVLKDPGVEIIVQFDNGQWVVTYEAVNGVPRFSCLAEFSDKCLTGKLAERLTIMKEEGYEQDGDHVDRTLLERRGQQRLFD